MTTLTMRDEGKKLTEQDLDEEEKRLGRPIPEAYRRFLLEHNGGHPNRSEFGGEEPLSIKSFLGIQGPEETLDLDYVLSTFGDRVPPGFFPVARDPGGNLIGILDGSVWLWDHEREAEEGEAPTMENMQRLADDFDAFVEQLEEV